VLDKSIEFKSMTMRLPIRRFVFSEPKLPDGFTIRAYQKGDLEAWAKIEVSVGEFENNDKAYESFNKLYLPYENMLPLRMFFVVAPSGEPVATATAFFSDKRKWMKSVLHWVAVKPEFQGKGLGRAIVQKALNAIVEFEPKRDIYLFTQTWSHKAVKLYLSLGFKMVRTPNGLAKIKFGYKRGNDYKGAIRILKSVYDEQTYKDLTKIRR